MFEKLSAMPAVLSPRFLRRMVRNKQIICRGCAAIRNGLIISVIL
jgi:hypothetical protein